MDLLSGWSVTQKWVIPGLTDGQVNRAQARLVGEHKTRSIGAGATKD